MNLLELTKLEKTEQFDAVRALIESTPYYEIRLGSGDTIKIFHEIHPCEEDDTPQVRYIIHTANGEAWTDVSAGGGYGKADWALLQCFRIAGVRLAHRELRETSTDTIGRYFVGGNFYLIPKDELAAI